MNYWGEGKIDVGWEWATCAAKRKVKRKENRYLPLDKKWTLKFFLRLTHTQTFFLVPIL